MADPHLKHLEVHWKDREAWAKITKPGGEYVNPADLNKVIKTLQGLKKKLK